MEDEKLGEDVHQYSYEWSELDDIQDEKSILLNDFNHDPQSDLERGILKKNRLRPPPRISEDERSKATQQPQFHQNNKVFFESLCGCCVRNKDLNKRELRFFRKFKQSMINLYDENNKTHEAHLKQFYLKVVTQEEQLNMIDEKWKDLGFQSKNPRTDFRGGGHLSLMCLMYFYDYYPREFEELASVTKDRQEVMWLTAISSINITHGLVIYLYLNDGEDALPQQYLRLRAGRNQFKKFCHLNSMSKRAFFELNIFALRFLYYEWMGLVRKQGSKGIAMLMGGFNDCLHKAKAQVHLLLSDELLDMTNLNKKIEEILRIKAIISIS